MKKIADIVGQTNRVKQVLAKIGLTRNEFCKIAGIPTSTWNTYINNHHRPLSVKASHKIVDALSQLGIICSSEWLLTGDGPAPTQSSCLKNLIADSQHDQSTIIIDEAIQSFQSTYDNSVILKINDLSMSPILESGDYVGGAWREGDVLNFYDKKLCLIKLNHSDIICRQLDILSNDDDNIIANLIPINPYAQSSALFVEGIELQTIARVTRIWKASIMSNLP